MSLVRVASGDVRARQTVGACTHRPYPPLAPVGIALLAPAAGRLQLLPVMRKTCGMHARRHEESKPKLWRPCLKTGSWSFDGVR
jgi:hypothetical protein